MTGDLLLPVQAFSWPRGQSAITIWKHRPLLPLVALKGLSSAQWPLISHLEAIYSLLHTHGSIYCNREHNYSGLAHTVYVGPMSCLYICCCMMPCLITVLELTSGESNSMSFNTGEFPYAGLYNDQIECEWYREEDRVHDSTLINQ